MKQALGYSKDVQSMQTMLAQVATAKGDYKYHPYRTDGRMSMGTVVWTYFSGTL